ASTLAEDLLKFSPSTHTPKTPPPAREHHRLSAETILRPLRRPLHHEVGHLSLHLRRPAPTSVPPALRRQPPPRTAPHPICCGFFHCSVIPSGVEGPCVRPCSAGT